MSLRMVLLLSLLAVVPMAAQDKPAPPKALTPDVAAEITGVYYADFRETMRFYSKEYGTNLEMPEVDGRRNTKYLNPHAAYSHFMRFMNRTFVIRDDGSVVVVEAMLPSQASRSSASATKRLGRKVEAGFFLLSSKLASEDEAFFADVLDVLDRPRFPESLSSGGGYGLVPEAIKIHMLDTSGMAVGREATFDYRHRSFPNYFSRVPSRLWKLGDGTLLVMGGNGLGYGVPGFSEVTSLPIVIRRMPESTKAKLVPAIEGVNDKQRLVGLVDPYRQHFGAALLLKKPEELRPDKGAVNYFHWRPSGDAVYKDWHLIPGWYPLDGTVNLPDGVLNAGSWLAE